MLRSSCLVVRPLPTARPSQAGRREAGGAAAMPSAKMKTHGAEAHVDRTARPRYQRSYGFQSSPAGWPARAEAGVEAGVEAGATRGGAPSEGLLPASAPPPVRHAAVQADAGQSTWMLASVSQAAPPPSPVSSAAGGGRANTLLGIIAASLSVALSVLMLAVIPTLRAIRDAARETTLLMRDLRQELPDTFATMRLSGLEVADCVEELGELSADLSGGIRSAARAINAAESTTRGMGRAAAAAVKNQVVPGIVPVVEGVLQENAQLPSYSGDAVIVAARRTAKLVKRTRKVVKAGSLAAYGYGVAGWVGLRRAAKAAAVAERDPFPAAGMMDYDDVGDDDYQLEGDE